MIIDVQNLNIKIGNDRVLIKDLSFSLECGDRLAIIGEEGDGKSTILKAIAAPKEIEGYSTISGKINLYGNKVGYLEQNLSSKWDLLEVCSFYLRDNPEDEDDFDRYNLFGEVSKYFTLFELSASLLESSHKIGALSGGEKVKIQLTKLLIKNPDILLLDEPTNDLDLYALKWLESFILSINKPIIYISHDETLLENTANAILHIEQIKNKTENKWTYQKTTYREYIKERLSLIEKQTQIAKKERKDDALKMEKWNQIYNKVNYQLNNISRQDPHGARLLKKKMQAVKSQEKRFDRERQQFTDIPDPEESIDFFFGNESIPNGKIVCDLLFPSVEVGGRILAENVSLTVVGPEKVVIIGNNGSGKTTLLKKILGELKNRSDVSVGYMPQNYEELLCKYHSVQDFIFENTDSKEEMTLIRTYLGCLKFTKEEVSGNIDELSGGQKAKLFLAKLMANKHNILVLDEPTRNLSPLSCPVLRKSLMEYRGCIISVSHDRKYIKEVCNKIYKFTKNGLELVTDLH